MGEATELVQPAATTEEAAGLLHGRSWGVVLRLAWPVLLQQLLIFLVGLSDTFLAGHYEPPDRSQVVAYQAAQTNANYLLWVMSSYTVLVTTGATALVARFIGAGDRRMAIRATNQAMVLGVVFGLGGGLLGLLSVRPLVAALQLHGEAADFAAAYLVPLFLGLVFQMLEATGVACLVGTGDTRTGLMVLGGVAVANLPLAWFFCWGVGPWHGLGFEGIAVGTAVSHLCGCTAVVLLLAKGRSGLLLHPALLRPDRSLLERLMRVGVPAGIDSLSLVAGQLWFLSIINHLGDAAIGAHGIALRWEALGYLSGAAFSTAAMAMVGQNLGAGRPGDAARSGWMAFALGCGVMSTMGAIFFTFARPMFQLFCPAAEQAAVIETGVPVLRLVAFTMPMLACTIVFTGALRGAGDTRIPVLFTWIGFLGVRIPLAYLLTSEWVGLGLFGAWLAMFADLYLRGAFFFTRFASGKWKQIRV